MPYLSMWAIVLAAGKGTRMHSAKPKVLQTLLGEPMLAYVLNALQTVFGKNILAVVGYGAESIAKAFPDLPLAIQEPQLGTAHALSCALAKMQDQLPQYVLVANGDCPLLKAPLVEKFLKEATGADIAFATITLPDAGAYGRVIRENGNLRAIVEAKDYQEDKYGKPTGEINSGLWLFRTEVVMRLLPLVTTNNNSKEFYLTDLAALGLEKGLDTRAISLGNEPDLLGINTPLELAAMENRLAETSNRELMASGVVIHHPAALRVSPFAQIMPGVELNGPAQISGNTRIESGTVIGSFCYIKNCRIGPDCEVLPYCHLENAIVAENCRLGPYARLRPGARMEKNSHAGNFVEMKNAVLGKGSKANHLTYLGDSTIGEGVNIGAGTITCNYDGKKKHHTEIGDHVFIGSNSSLVAPVTIGDNALVGAGSVITRDVPPENLGIGRAKQKNLPRKPFLPHSDDEPEK